MIERRRKTNEKRSWENEENDLYRKQNEKEEINMLNLTQYKSKQ